MQLHPFVSSLIVTISEFGPVTLALVVAFFLALVLFSKEPLSKRARSLLSLAFVLSIATVLLTLCIKRFIYQIG